MKRILLFKTIIVAAMLCMGTSNVWAYGSQRVYPGSSINVGNDYNGSDEVLAPEYEWYEWRF